MEYELDRPDVFPSATNVGLYLASQFRPGEDVPIGAPIAEVEVDPLVKEGEEEVRKGTTAITFPEVTEAVNYIAAAEVEGTWRKVHFVPGTMGKSLEPPARFPSHSAG